MKPEDRALLQDIQKRLIALERAENVSFIKSLERRFAFLRNGANASDVSTITQAARNSADTGSVNVAKLPTGKLQITFADGTIKYIGTYDS